MADIETLLLLVHRTGWQVHSFWVHCK